MQLLIQVLINAISMGFIYSLVAMEYTIIWNATGLLNFSHDKFIMLSAYVFAVNYVMTLGLPVPLALLCSIITMFLFGVIAARQIFIPMQNMPSPLFAVVGTILLGRIITEGVRLIWGTTPFTLPGFLRGSYRMHNLNIPRANIVIIIVALIMVVLIQLLFKYTKIGKAMRCVSQNKVASSYMGINVNRSIAITIGLSAVICFFIGIMVIPLFNIESTMANLIGVKGFSAGVIGGFGYLPGAIVGGIVLGVVEGLSIYIVPAVYKDVMAYILLIIFLLVRPSGILGYRNNQK